jgi:D-amino peptidase
MRIYVMTDMEGVCGVMDHDNWVAPSGRYYDAGRKLLTLEVNAAVDAFFSEGASEVVVIDGHGYGGINQDLIDRRVYLAAGFTDPFPCGLDSSFDAMAWVGQHAKAGTEYAHISHTGWFNVLDYKINGISVGEFGQYAMLGTYMGVKPIFATGDKAFTIEAEELVKGIETVSIKKGLTPGSGNEYDCTGYRSRNLAAIHMHPEKARELIYEGAVKAMKRFRENKASFSDINLTPPYIREVWYRPDGKIPAGVTRTEDAADLLGLMNRKEHLRL